MTTNRSVLSLGFLFLLALGAAQSVSAEIFSARADNSDSVYFRSSAKLEFIEGITTDLIGSVEINCDDPSRSTGRFRVDLRTLRTGLETRDKHMRQRHLHTKTFPFAYFELTSMQGFDPNRPVGAEQACRGEGLFYIHGVKRAMTADLNVIRVVKDDGTTGYKIRAVFGLTLDDYQIKRPKLLFLKLAELIEVEIVLDLYPAMTPGSITFPDFELID